MNFQDVKDVMLGYDAVLSNRNIIVQRNEQYATLAHVRWMVNEVQTWGASPLSSFEVWFKTTQKAHRWLGFVQGVLVAHGIFTIADVKEHSRTRQVGACLRTRVAAKVAEGI